MTKEKEDTSKSEELKNKKSPQKTTSVKTSPKAKSSIEWRRKESKDEIKQVTKAETKKKEIKVEVKKIDKSTPEKEIAVKEKSENKAEEKKALTKNGVDVEPSKEVVVEEEFDWEAYSKEEDYEKKQHDEFVSIYEETLSSIVEKEVIDGNVISVSNREVVVDIGFKSSYVLA